MDVDLSDRVEPLPPRGRPGEWLEYSRILPILVGLLTLGWLVNQFVTLPVLTVISSLNGYLTGLPDPGPGPAWHAARVPQGRHQGRPHHGRHSRAVPAVRRDGGHPDRAPGRGGDHGLRAPRGPSSPASAAAARFAVVIALYTALLGLFVPSGGGKWLVEAPYVMQSATDVAMNLGWTVQIYNAAEALPNLINPFFMLPLLAVLGVRARDLVGFTFLQFLFHLPVVLLLLWLLGMTFQFEPPVMP